jgi:uncharacterized protein YecE (DUF72 family)
MSPGSERNDVTRILAGTCGFAYRDWRGPFYPADLPQSRMLPTYARRLPTVEIDSTFYRPPDPGTLAGWYRVTPPGFLFALKAPREITHARRLAGIAEPVRALYLAAAELGEKLGPVLFQLPPTLERDLALLRDLLALVPRGGRTALEFRHASWRDDRVLAALHEAGAAPCIVDALRDEMPLVPTARFGYLRLQRPDYGVRALAAWVERLRAQPWDEAFVYFKSARGAVAPALARALAARAADFSGRAPAHPTS